MATKTITIQYKKSGSRYLFTCTTADSSTVVAVGDFMALVALEAFKGATRLEVLVKPGTSTPFASSISLGVSELGGEDGGQEAEFTPFPLSNGARKFAAVSAEAAKIAEKGCGLLVRVKVGSADRDFGVGLVAVTRGELFNASGGLALIKLPAPSPTIGSQPSTTGTIGQPVFPRIPEDRLPKVLEVEGLLPRGGLNKP